MRAVVLTGVGALVLCAGLAMGSAWLVGREGVRGQVADTSALCGIGTLLFGSAPHPRLASDWLVGVSGSGAGATGKVREVFLAKGSEVAGIAPYGISELERDGLAGLAKRLKRLGRVYGGGRDALSLGRGRGVWWKGSEGRALDIEERVVGSGVLAGCFGEA